VGEALVQREFLPCSRDRLSKYLKVGDVNVFDGVN